MDSLNLSSSVAISTYNGLRFVKDQIDSILLQSVQATEIIIVDDCSTDGTVEILKEYAQKYKEIKLVLQKTNSGPIPSFELAIKSSSCPYIFLADQDDIWKPNKIETMLSIASKYSNDKPLLIYSDLEVIGENGEALFSSFWKMASLKPKLTTFKSLMFANVITGCGSLINSKMKQFLCSIPHGVLMHDHWIGLIAYGFGETCVIDDQLVKYRVHSDSVTVKKPATILWKVQTQLDQFFKGNNTFLEKEINQITLYNRNFRNLLTKKQQDHLDNFLDLKNKSFLQKKLVSYLKYKK